MIVTAINADLLVKLSAARKNLVANKTRDFAAEWSKKYPWHQWAPFTCTARSPTTGELTVMHSAGSYNARERRWERGHALLPRYNSIAEKAFKKVKLP